MEVLNLTEESQKERLDHEEMLLNLEAKKRAFLVEVPTLPADVRKALRSLGLPVRLFGENLANVRDRLKLALAKQELVQEQSAAVGGEGKVPRQQESDEEAEVTKYSQASSGLIQARESFAKYSFEKAQGRLAVERNYRVQWQRKRIKLSSLATSNPDEASKLQTDDSEYAELTRSDEECNKLYQHLGQIGLEGSQYGDGRPLSSIGTPLQSSDDSISSMVATGSWSGTIKLWDGSNPSLDLLGERTMAHEDRIMGIAVRPSSSPTDALILASASIDLTAKLWKVTKNNDSDVTMSDAGTKEEKEGYRYRIEEAVHLKGHAARLCSVAFHPLGDYVATTSFDHTWRLWDVATGAEILLQDGHWKEVYGIGFHPDGSLCATTDYGGVTQVWDLRTGKSACHFLGHAKRVVCADFSPNGFQLATAGDDGTIKVWDLRKRKQFASIPAHSRLITQVQFAANPGHDPHRGHNPLSGEYLASTSFDGTVKLWSSRSWKLLNSGRGHEGKVMGVGLLRNSSMVTCGFDKTIKLWR